MTVNLSSNRTEINNGYNDVIAEDCPTCWVIFGYESNSNVLTLEDSGDDLDDLAVCFNSGHVQYALCSVKDPETNMTRLMLINWQGEGCPTGTLGMVASHFPVILNHFKGVHLSFNARSEDDVTTDELFAQMKKCRTAGPLIPMSTTEDKQMPVGSVYRRVNPAQEINTRARDSFWEQTEKEELARIQAESKRKSVESEHYQKEKEILQKHISDEFHHRPKSGATAGGIECRPGESEVDAERRTKSEQLKKERMQEIQEAMNNRQKASANGVANSPEDIVHSPRSPTKSPTKTNKIPVSRRWPPVAPSSPPPIEKEPSPPSRPKLIMPTMPNMQSGDASTTDNRQSVKRAPSPPAPPQSVPPSIPPVPPTQQSSVTSGSTKETVSVKKEEEAVRFSDAIASVVPPRMDSDSESAEEDEQDWDSK